MNGVLFFGKKRVGNGFFWFGVVGFGGGESNKGVVKVWVDPKDIRGEPAGFCRMGLREQEKKLGRTGSVREEKHEAHRKPLLPTRGRGGMQAGWKRRRPPGGRGGSARGTLGPGGGFRKFRETGQKERGELVGGKGERRLKEPH